jgi:DNA-binding response OmpR family regulator
VRTALVVEDREELGMLLGLFLERLGWRAVHARAGEEAVELAEHAELDLLFIDVSLGGLSGPAVAARLREARPELPVLLMSGHTASEVRRVAADAGVPDVLAQPRVTLLTKPFGLSELREAVEALVD